jgi:hypothetical protein
VKWWEAPEYDRKQPMDFPDLRASTPMRRIGKDVYFLVDAKTHTARWVSVPIRIYVGPSFV